MRDSSKRGHRGYALAVHGGAGTLRRGDMTGERETLYRAGLAQALTAGRDILADGGSALDAVTAAVCALEDDPLFNAGRGAVFTRAGTQEMDAAIMDGRERRAGAVAGIFGPRNPIRAARRVMEASPHVMLIGDGAIQFCRDAGLAFAEADYFFTAARWQALAETLAQEAAGRLDSDESRRHGTVGAVARDRAGNLAAATSTGGMTGKLPGRVGDSPIIGAGTFADNRSCAVSATGHGEFFIRYTAAHEVAARIAQGGRSLAEAAQAVVGELARIGGSGGLVAVGRDGAPALPFNCAGMYRGYVKADGIVYTAIYYEPYTAL
jgi:beta-aspartyl-peptidase (threonine type)